MCCLLLILPPCSFTPGSSDCLNGSTNSTSPTTTAGSGSSVPASSATSPSASGASSAASRAASGSSSSSYVHLDRAAPCLIPLSVHQGRPQPPVLRMVQWLLVSSTVWMVSLGRPSLPCLSESMRNSLKTEAWRSGAVLN